MGLDLPLARRDAIAARLADGQPVNSAVLAVEFCISEDAIRRDLRSLAAQGLCRRVYGGALPLQPGSTSITKRMGEGRERKAALARAAAATIVAGEFVFLDSSSTNLLIVDAMVAPEVTIATNSIAIAAAVLGRHDMSLLMVGGAVDPIVGGCVDAMAVQAVSRMNIDRCFLGACAVSVEGGVSAFEVADAAFKGALMAASRRKLVLVTNEKLDLSAPHRIGALSGFDRIVVEHDAPDAAIRALAKAGADLGHAGPSADAAVDP